MIDSHVIIPLHGPIEELFSERNISYSIVNYRFDSGYRNGTISAYLIYLIKCIRQKWLSFFAIKRLEKIVANENFEIIHTNSSVNTIGIRLAMKCNMKHVWHIREFQKIGLSLRPYSGWNKYSSLIKKSDFRIFVSQSLANFYGNPIRSEVIFDAVSDMRSLMSENLKDPYFLFVGSLLPMKGVEMAIDAFRLFERKHKGYSLIIVGDNQADSAFYNKILRKVEEYHLNAKIEFLGFRRDVVQLMSKAQALLMCSINEGMGRVIPEAMLNNCIVVGRNSGATKELLINQITGFLFESSEELSEIMDKITADHDYLKDIQKNAFDFACRNFLEEHYGDKIVSVYKSICS